MREPTRPREGMNNWPHSRVLAALVLFPTVPMLLLSVSALGLFYLAPSRFGSLLARLPGESIIRSALVFAPATLFAIVVLALLYVLEKPQLETGERVERRPAQRTLPLKLPSPRISGLVLGLVCVPAWLLSLALWALSFVSPGRYDRLMKPLPGDTLLRPLIPFASIILFLLVLAAVVMFARGSAAGRARGRTMGEERLRVTRFSVGLVLLPTLPAFLVSLAALLASLLFPVRFESLLGRLPFESLIRSVLLFAPITLLAVLLLAGGYLLHVPGRTLDAMVAARRQESAAWIARLRSSVAMWVLTGGLLFTAFAGIGVLSVLIYIVFR